jgi:XTP/dITP diphosphohydrolase
VFQKFTGLRKASRIQDKGWDWEEPHQVWDKVQEELEELQVEVEAVIKIKLKLSLGCFIFDDQLCSFNVNPEDALERTNKNSSNAFNI